MTAICVFVAGKYEKLRGIQKKMFMRIHKQSFLYLLKSDFILFNTLHYIKAILCGLKQISNSIQSSHKLPSNDSQFALSYNSQSPIYPSRPPTRLNPLKLPPVPPVV